MGQLDISRSADMLLSDMLKSNFLGPWNIKRSISGSQSGLFTGTAQFSDAGKDRLYYEEQGFLSLPNSRPAFCRRSYWYKFCTDDLVQVLFSDNRPFLMLNFNQEFTAKGQHACGLDCYHAHYYFKSENRLFIEFQVKGPEKDYLITSQYGGSSRI